MRGPAVIPLLGPTQDSLPGPVGSCEDSEVTKPLTYSSPETLGDGWSHDRVTELGRRAAPLLVYISLLLSRSPASSMWQLLKRFAITLLNLRS